MAEPDPPPPSPPPPSPPPPSPPPPSPRQQSSPQQPGPRQPPGKDQLARAREALAAARGQARARSGAPAAPAAGQGEARTQPVPVERAGESQGQPTARRVRREDPQPLAAAIGGLVEAEGWSAAAATGSVFGRWAEIVGPELAGHTRPERLREGELTVAADSTAWATQLRLLAAQLVRRLNVELGAGTVQRVKVVGPASATRRPGEWRVRGGRGPRDTYG
jgi:predicted nucleic acid-binding Zn ribbon protein